MLYYKLEVELLRIDNFKNSFPGSDKLSARKKFFCYSRSESSRHHKTFLTNSQEYAGAVVRNFCLHSLSGAEVLQCMNTALVKRLCFFDFNQCTVMRKNHTMYSTAYRDLWLYTSTFFPIGQPRVAVATARAKRDCILVLQQ